MFSNQRVHIQNGIEYSTLETEETPALLICKTVTASNNSLGALCTISNYVIPKISNVILFKKQDKFNFHKLFQLNWITKEVRQSK